MQRVLCTRNVESVVFEADSVNSDLSRYKLDGVSVSSEVLQLTLLGGA